MTNNGKSLTYTYTYDRELIKQKIKKCKSLFMDTNVWIDLQNTRNAKSVAVCQKLEDAVKRGKLFCPVSFATISEMYKQNHESRIKTAQLMDTLSLGITYVISKEVYKWEAERYCNLALTGEYGNAETDYAYVPLMGYLSQHLSMTYKVGNPDGLDEQINRDLMDLTSKYTLTQLVTAGGERMHRGVMSLPKCDYKPGILELRKRCKGNKTRIFLHEAFHMFKNDVSDTMARTVYGSSKDDFMEVINAIPPDEFGSKMSSILLSLPAVHNHIEILATMAQYPTRDFKDNDFYDIDMSPVPLAYSHGFVTSDGWMIDLIKNRSQILSRTRCSFLTGIDDLDTWLDAQCAS